MVLETERLILRNFKPTDIEDYWEYVQMPNVGPRAGWPAYTDKQKAIDWLENVECKKPNQFAIVLKDENKVIGSVDLMECVGSRYEGMGVEDGAKEIGFVLSETYWGRGIVTEAARAVLSYAFDVLGIQNIYIGHAKANIGSGKVQDKLGFKIIGEVKNYRTWVDGTQTDFVARKMTKQEWDAKKV